MVIFDFNDYRRFLKFFLENSPRKGRGLSAKFAQVLGVNSTMISQVLHEKAHLNQEHSLKLARHIGLNPLETDYLVNLVLMNRAGDKQTESYFEQQLNEIRKKSQSIKDRLSLNSDLSEENRAQYYSLWYYSAIWLLVAIEGFQTQEAIATKLSLNREQVSEAVHLLIKIGLMTEELGILKMRGQHIHISADSPLVRRHHLNWRTLSASYLSRVNLATNLFFTGPVVISRGDSEKIRELLLKNLDIFRKISGPSACEALFCLNIDWFEV